MKNIEISNEFTAKKQNDKELPPRQCVDYRYLND